jgi:hypothetical protein
VLTPLKILLRELNVPSCCFNELLIGQGRKVVGCCRGWRAESFFGWWLLGCKAVDAGLIEGDISRGDDFSFT